MLANLQFIGVIHSPLKNIEDCPLQEKEDAPAATIEVYPEFVAAAGNLEPGNEIWLLTWLHMADRNTLTCVPRRDYGSPQLGVFSTRSPDRPNPIGLHRVKIVDVSKNGVITVASLEALDQTPVIDIKPVI